METPEEKLGIPDLTEAFSLGNINIQRRGFTVLEALVTIAVISVIGGVVIPSVFAEYQQAHLSNCVAQLEQMKAVAHDLGVSGSVPNPTEFWAEGFPDAEDGEYYYIVDEQDANKGHGNDLDGCDEDNPGTSPPCAGTDITFVVLCNHDHGQFGSYIYATDQVSPTVVEVDGDDPGYKGWLAIANTNGTRKEGKEPTKPGKGRNNSPHL